MAVNIKIILKAKKNKTRNNHYNTILYMTKSYNIRKNKENSTALYDFSIRIALNPGIKRVK